MIFDDFDDFGAVFRFHRVYGMLSWTMDSLQRFVELLRIISVGKTLYLFGLLSPPFNSPSGEGPFVPCCVVPSIFDADWLSLDCGATHREHRFSHAAN